MENAQRNGSTQANLHFVRDDRISTPLQNTLAAIIARQLALFRYECVLVFGNDEDFQFSPQLQSAKTFL